MSQNDLVIANQSAPDFRSDLNDALQALGSLNSGSTAPSTTYANMLWYDTSNNILKMRTEADDAWIDLGTLNQSTNEFEVANLTELTQTQAEDDTDTTYGTVTGEILAGVVEANASSPIKAWVNFDGTGTVSINDSLNVSSITDNGIGDYTINFETALSHGNYALSGTAQRSSGTIRSLQLGPINDDVTTTPYTTSSARIICTNESGGNEDGPLVTAMISGG